MPDFDQIQFNTHAFSELSTLLKTNKIPNALLFYGKDNTRRKEAAFFFAKGANCVQPVSERPCGLCRPCTKIDSQNHPDIHTITLLKGKKNILISQIRDMTLAVSSKPNEAKTRLIMIFEADKMNTQSQNALLKLLEEPPEKTLFILLAQKESLILPTIASRCRKIRFKPLTEKMVARVLIEKHGITPQAAEIVSKTADSNLKKALGYLNLDTDNLQTDWIKRRQWLLTSLANIVNKGPLNITHALNLSRKISSAPDLTEDTLAVVRTFFRDLSIFRWSPESIVNHDFFDTFADINQKVRHDFFHYWLTTLYETEKRLQSNSSLRLSLDRFFLKLALAKETDL